MMVINTLNRVSQDKKHILMEAKLLNNPQFIQYWHNQSKKAR